MSYFADTIVDYVVGEYLPDKGTLRFILPSLPSGILLYIGKRLDEHFKRIHQRRVRFLYGIAYRLGKQWETQTLKDKMNFQEICSLGWYNDSNNLTCLRNEIKGNSEDNLIIVLAGFEHIDDRASLQDFFRLDQQVLWEVCLKKSFGKWLHDCLQPYLNIEDTEEDFQKIDELLKALFDNGLADLLSISSFLEEIDFSVAMNGTDAYRHVLINMAPFKLPRMPGLASKYAKKPAFYYLSEAVEFFNYSMFLDESKRKSFTQKIERFQAKNPSLEPEGDILGNFHDLHSLLEALKDYINNRSVKAASDLRTADFVFICEQVFGFKEKGPQRDPQPKKLNGLPPEVFLRAIWLTLGDFKKNLKSRSTLMMEEPPKIIINGLVFKHDFNAGEDDDAAEVRENAKTFLCQVIGGIDALLEEHVRIELGDYHNPVTIPLISNLDQSAKNGLKYEHSSTATSSLKFEVTISSERHETIRKEFVWALPQNHQCRFLVELIKWVSKQFMNSSNALPCFAMPYLPEVFMASEEEEATRILITSLRNQEECFMIDLLEAPGIDVQEESINLLGNLSIAYQEFLTVFNKSGFFVALNNGYEHLRKAFTEAYMKYLDNSNISTVGPLLFKAFMIVEENKPQSAWSWRDHLKGVVVSPLHPATLEMIRHQHTYLCDSFCYYAKIAIEESGDKMFSEGRWDRVVDLAKLHRPIYGVLKDANLALDTNVRSYNYIHLVGDCSKTSSLINSRLLLENDDADEEEDIADTELFRETRSSWLIKKVLLKYRELYAYGDDGISIGAYCGGDVQAVIAGVNDFLAEILVDRSDRKYTLHLTIFSDSRDDSAVMRWINAWKDRFQEADGYKHYHQCRISIAYRILASREGFDQFKTLLNNMHLDVMVFADFIKSTASRFELLEEEPFGDEYRKFPVLEKACCKVVGGGLDEHRERILSNHRFRLGSLHTEVMACIKNNGQRNLPNKHAVINKADFGPWVEVVNTAHKQSAWVVCIDPAVDEQLLQRSDANGANLREIIGVGTGVGSHGENNYTISTEQFSMADIKKKINLQIGSLLGPLGQIECGQIADSLITSAAQITGLSVVKATGPVRFVRELISNAMVRKLLPRDQAAFCDEIISLDAFAHWFDDAVNSKRPDLLRLHATNKNGVFHFEAQIIECKLAQQTEGFLEKARQQIENGLRRLVDCFRPRGESLEGLDHKPDQRYWWMQLHRLVASKGEVSKPKYKETLLALERLSEGCFNINWQAGVVAFWIDQDNDTLQLNPEWNFSLDGQDMNISVATAGKNFIKRACLEKAQADIFGSAAKLSFSYQKKPAEGVGVLGYNAPTTEDNEAAKPKNNYEAVNVDTPKQVVVPKGKKASSAVKKSIPGRILLGTLSSGGRNIYWEFGHPNLPNRHILVFGASGTGKTYTIQALLCELGKAGQNSLIVDYTRGFTSKQLEPTFVEGLKPCQHVVIKEPLSINPFRQQNDYIDDIILPEDPAITAQRVSGVFAEVYQLGDQQKSVLYNSIRDGITREKTRFGLASLISRIEDMLRLGGPTANSAASLLSKIQPFVDMKPFGNDEQESWEKLFSDDNSRCHVIQLAGFMKDTARLITEFSLIDLYWHYRARGSKDEPKVIVLDEIQNLDHQLDSPLGQFLTEGRKFGISLILATQTLSNFGKDERDRLFQAGHKLFFKPADTEVRTYAQILADATGSRMEEWVDRLSSLKRGECYSLGYAFNDATSKLEVGKWFKIQIKPLEQRGECFNAVD